MSQRVLGGLILLTLVAGLFLSPAIAPASVRAQAADAKLDALIAGMTVEERVGQLFLVTFVGDQVAPPSDIAELIQIYRVGGVVLLARNGNIRNQGDTPAKVAGLVNQLQELALTAPSLTTAYPEAVGVTESVTHIPLFIAVDHEGDGYPYTQLINGFTPVPSAMAIGATWDDEMAQAIGEIVGAELRAVGVNLLLGPSLDVLDTPRPGVSGDLGIRAFGGDPYWVGRLGEAYIRGVHLGSEGRVATVAKHFPGHGGSDRRADEEIATVNKSLQELYRIELAPFVAVTKKSKLGSPSATDALMTSHIRYRGFQGNIRQLTRPISFDAQNLPALMLLPEFAPWREAGGLLVSDSLGVLAVRKYYDPQLQTFPYRQIAQEAFMAGNDLLVLSQFALHDVWSEQFENIKATIAFFQEKYVNDAAFRDRVDKSLRRILRLKLRLYPEFSIEAVQAGGKALEAVGKGNATVLKLAEEALTLIYPDLADLSDRLPSPPLPDESILFFTDARQVADCADPQACPPTPAIDPQALANIVLRLYGPGGSGRVVAENVHSLSFADLREYLTALATGGEKTEAIANTERLIGEAKWIVFAMLDINVENAPNSDAIRQFLRSGEPKLRDKNLIVLAFGEPYHLDTTEISKLTAYYGLYSKTAPFLEVAARVLFQEILPKGASPVSIAGINYDLITVTGPDPNQIIQVKLGPLPAATGGTATPVGLAVGSTLRLSTNPILDHNGHPVPDGTPVEFRLFYPAEQLELPRLNTTTVNGVAEAAVVLERTGQLNVTASSGNAVRSTTLQVTIQGSEPAQIATVVPSPTFTSTPVPTPTPAPTATPTHTPTFTPSPTHTPEPTSTATPTATETVTVTATPSSTVTPPAEPFKPLWGDLALSLLVLVSMSSVAGVARAVIGGSAGFGVRLFLWLMVGGLIGYVLYAQGLLPAALVGSFPATWKALSLTVAGGIVVGALSLAFESPTPPSNR